MVQLASAMIEEEPLQEKQLKIRPLLLEQRMETVNLTQMIKTMCLSSPRPATRTHHSPPQKMKKQIHLKKKTLCHKGKNKMTKEKNKNK